MNHNRCWAYDSGTTAGRCCATNGAHSRAPACAPIHSANPATVYASNNARIGTSTPSSALSRAISRVADKECPPRSKNDSSMPTRATPSTSPNSAANTRSRSSRGARYAAALTNSGAGKPRRSSLPLTVSGSDSTTMTAAGTMNSGNRSAAKLRNSATRSIAAGSFTCPASEPTPAPGRYRSDTTRGSALRV
ncbi:hypothetical protein MMAN_16090 [Mycobacterium mantenii]|uniref:Uncharacterized protein n=1 Tax=Mycobacterium mantenii TaxID=560555 RepID=A0ABM7JR72_MYCNT|nr:hypothetical protein MMAN_16090 [Mycobacterium mantenii]